MAATARESSSSKTRFLAEDVQSLSMENRKRLKASFGTQANALLRKNITYQKRNMATNVCIVGMPVLMCVLLKLLQFAINMLLEAPAFKCGCGCPLPAGQVPVSGGPRYRSPSECEAAGVPVQCGVEFSTTSQLTFCAFPQPPMYPAFLQTPWQDKAAVQRSDDNYPDLPPPACQTNSSMKGCFASGLVTGENLTVVHTLAQHMLNPFVVPQALGLPALNATVTTNSTAARNSTTSTTSAASPTPTNSQSTLSSNATSAIPSYLDYLGYLAPGTPTDPTPTILSDWALTAPIQLLVPSCKGVPSPIAVSINTSVAALNSFQFSCTPAKFLVRNNRSAINNAMFNGFQDVAAKENTTNQYIAGYDFQNTSVSQFNPIVMFNSTFPRFQGATGGQSAPPNIFRFARSLNVATNAFLKTFFGKSLDIPILFVTDFPKPDTGLSLDFASVLGPLFYMWILQLLFPVFIQHIVYEKEKNTRTMMRMHGLSDGPYWLISYAYFLVFSIAFIALFVLFGSLMGLQFFRLNSYTIQAVFYLVFVNAQISFAILTSAFFANTRVASVVSYLYVFAGGLLGTFLFSFFLGDKNFPDYALFILELIPCFSLYRCLYELSQSAFIGNYQGTAGTLTWSNLTHYGVTTALAIMAVEWAVFLALGLYLDQVVAVGSGIKKHPLFFLDSLLKRWRKRPASASLSFAATDNNANGDSTQLAGKKDVMQEKMLVESLLHGANDLESDDKKEGEGVPGTQSWEQTGSEFSGIIPSSLISSRDFSGEVSSVLSFSSTYPSKPQNPGSADNGADSEMTTGGNAEGLGFNSGAAAGAENESPTDDGADSGSAAQHVVPVIGGDAAGGKNLDGKDFGGKHGSGKVGALGSRSEFVSMYPIICDDLRKVYPARDGSKSKVAVKGMSLAVGRGECFGMLGPNGAGKSTSLNMMIGFLRPTSGTAIIEGMDILEDVNSIYSVMGVCPQHDLLWDQLSGREHLLFYGRLKNLKGKELTDAVEESLASVNLLKGGVADKRSGQYSGGMKRRLSVAISLIGKPPVVYMDEPSTGLDPASRKLLWDVVKKAKKDSCIILTTHSMEEAEALCDRLGIFVSGEFSCIGNPKQLTARFGGSFVFTVTTPPEEEEAAEKLARKIAPSAKLVYSLAGTQKFEMPIGEVELASVFEQVEEAKRDMNIRAWGIANTTLEDVFINIARSAAGGEAKLS